MPLGDDSPILPGFESVDDSRFVVRYFRRSKDGRLLFGGREIYAPGDPKDLHGPIRRQIVEVYPQLKDVELTHTWGGYVGITMPRTPFVREVMPNVISVGGYSGQRDAVELRRQAVRRDGAGQPRAAETFEELEDPPFPAARSCARRCFS